MDGLDLTGLDLTEVDLPQPNGRLRRNPHVSTPREVLPGRTYMITRRCTQRQFLMRPDRETNNAFIYCLAVAAERFGIRVLFTVAMSNHHHTGIYDPDGCYPAFNRALPQALRQVPERSPRSLGELLVLRADERRSPRRSRRRHQQDDLRPQQPGERQLGRQGSPLAGSHVSTVPAPRSPAFCIPTQALLP